AVAAAALFAAGVAVPASLYFRNANTPLENRFLIPTPGMPLADAAPIAPDGPVGGYLSRDAGSNGLFVRAFNSCYGVEASRTRRRRQLVLVSRQPFDRFLCRWKIEKGSSVGRTTGEHLRYAGSARRDVECSRCHRLCFIKRLAARQCCRWGAGRVDE